MQLSHLSAPLRVCSLRLHSPALQPRHVPRSARAAVRRRIRASKACRDAGLGFREVHVDSEAAPVTSWQEREARRRRRRRTSDTSHQVTRSVVRETN